MSKNLLIEMCPPPVETVTVFLRAVVLPAATPLRAMSTPMFPNWDLRDCVDYPTVTAQEKKRNRRMFVIKRSGMRRDCKTNRQDLVKISVDNRWSYS